MRSKPTALAAHTALTARRRRTLRMAAVALTAAAGLSLTACSGSDDNGAKSVGNAAAAESNGSASGAAAQGQGADAKTGTETGGKAGTKSAGARSGRANRSGDGSGTAVSNLPLPDGSEARVTKVGDQNFRAKIVDKGDVLATIETHDAAAGLDANDMFVVLTTDGRVHAWMGGGQSGPGTFALKGGFDAKVTKVGELHYRAQLLDRDGKVVDTIETADQHDVGVDANGVYIVLSNGGIISSHD
ncbi:hypothetical protein AB0A77_30685 [Streptomyces varsoviensis]|uniref:hypothetical protein n=1 Tax=Streptomyces varsoviensis TaxID=67373 RepID=UPI0033E04233